MARIADDEIERLKAEISLERLVESEGVQLKRRGKDLVGCCPMHEDKTPSLVVSREKNLWHCMGACQTGGSVIDWVMRRQSLGFADAVAHLRGMLTTESVVRKVEVARAAAVEWTAEDYALLREVVRHYHEALKGPEGEDARAYLESRGLGPRELMETFQIGYCNFTLGQRIPSGTTKAGLELRQRLVRLGVMRSGSGHEHFHGCVTVPINDANGQVVGLYGRRSKRNLTEDVVRHLYLPGPHRGVWNVKALAASPQVIVCEALLDAMTFWVAGFRNVTAAYGVNGFTEEHLVALKKHAVESVWIAYDRDEAGDKGAEELGQRLRKEGIACRRVLFPKGMDANEYALKVRPAEKSLKLALDNAVEMSGRKVATKEKAVVEEKAARVELVSTKMEPAPVTTTVVTKPIAPAVEAVPAAQVEEPHPPPGTDVVATQLLEPLLTTGVAAPVAREAQAEVAQWDGDEVVLSLGEQRYRARGLKKNTSTEVLRLNIYVAHRDAFYVDTLDLNQAKPRNVFIKQAAMELGISEEVFKRDVMRLFGELQRLQREHLQQALEPKKSAVVLSDDEKAGALRLLRDPELLLRILADFETCGLVGEELNKLTGYVATVSRKMDKPLALLVQSTTGAGKSALIDTLLSLLPGEEQEKFSAMTGQSLYYFGETELQHKVLALAEDEGAERIAYSLKLLQSDGELRIASTGKDPVTGELGTRQYHVQGPTMILLSTTKAEVNDEFLNRCLVLTADETREQTEAIHEAQREQYTLEGIRRKNARALVTALHRNAQRLIRPLGVLNPFVRQLTFRSDKTRLRRDHNKYLMLINALALLHQYQREVVTIPDEKGHGQEYVVVSIDDVEVANILANLVLGRSLDVVAPQARNLLNQLMTMVAAACERERLPQSEFRFGRREMLDVTGWSYTQLEVHLSRLIQNEYVLVHRGRRGQSYEYELVYDGHGVDGSPVLPGLVDVKALRGSAPAPGWLRKLEESSRVWRASSRGSSMEFTGSSRPHLGVISAPSRGGKNGEKVNGQKHLAAEEAAERENTRHRGLSNVLPSMAKETA